MDLVCIVCPFGCRMKVKKIGNKVVVAGNKCPRGEKYAIEEATMPTRTVTTSIKTANGVASVKTDKPVPKDKIKEVLSVIEKTYVKSPHYGEIVIHNVAGTEANVVVTSW